MAGMWRNVVVFYLVAATALPSSLLAAAARATNTTATTPIPVVGVKTGIEVNTGKRPARQNINKLYARGGPQWDLYILALSALQAVDEADELSYFQIAGIHGLPYSAWNGVGQVQGAPFIGYCPHGELLFSTWHRPYVVLFEQTLVSHALGIAGQYPPNVAPTYLAAAQTLRQPFWDWASDPRLPDAVTTANTTVNGPRGKLTLRNPLYSYQFQRPAVEASFGGPLTRYPETIRCIGQGGNNATESDQLLGSVAGGLVGMVYDVFTRTKTFEAMAYANRNWSSFESPHNMIHFYSSCDGTLGHIDWSAFDPLFMLHHCNIDRLVAMWQAIHYKDAMFNTTGVSTGEFGTPPGTHITADSPLKPFFDENLNLHTSKSVADIRVFGYTYPELDEDEPTTPDGLADHVRAQVNSLYGSDTQGAKHLSAPAQPKPPPACYYTAEISLDRAQIPLPATVNLVVHGGLVLGHMSILALPCEGTASASLPLREALLRGNLSLPDMTPTTVIPFLEQNLEVLISTSDGTDIPILTAPSLQLAVQNIGFVPRTNDSTFPHFGDTTRFWAMPVRQYDGC
ncbi:hypothetical protein B0T26DRAFT_805332 [Lasiosphaeria miniovina]|uniref:Tyrosinase copper-binding domain-containing protein n=1 Tax=Lasiosphaeria miniovina TaxID=1954250 RepID=A0AA40A5J6_9PEZI|nr:uncharacterized protein B0T26DRAFT_805332 [Lasiosphaeria miniovina]KAK0709679.1 hypothetical protein B0T26DRAFT_805332 [Lasiosphaeria miniovina]